MLSIQKYGLMTWLGQRNIRGFFISLCCIDLQVGEELDMTYRPLPTMVTINSSDIDWLNHLLLKQLNRYKT